MNRLFQPQRVSTVAWVVSGCLCALSWAALPGPVAAAELHLDAPEYTVAPGSSFTVHVNLDMDELMPGDQGPVAGLYSFGAKIMFDEDALSVADTNAIAIPAELDGNGLFGPAERAVGTGFAGAAGAVEFGATAGYMGTRVMSVTFNVLTAGVHTVRVGLYHQAPVANFIDYEGTELDPEITRFVRSHVRSGMDSPVIEVLEVLAGNTVRLVVAVPGFVPSALVLQGRSCGPSSAWTPESSVTVQDLGNGEYALECALPGEDCRHYRVDVAP